MEKRLHCSGNERRNSPTYSRSMGRNGSLSAGNMSCVATTGESLLHRRTLLEGAPFWFSGASCMPQCRLRGKGRICCRALDPQQSCIYNGIKGARQSDGRLSTVRSLAQPTKHQRGCSTQLRSTRYRGTSAGIILPSPGSFRHRRDQHQGKEKEWTNRPRMPMRTTPMPHVLFQARRHRRLIQRTPLVIPRSGRRPGEESSTLRGGCRRILESARP